MNTLDDIVMIKNPDEEFVKNLKNKIRANGKYCLNKQKGIKSNKCPCDEMKKNKICECGLYIRDPNLS